MSLLEMVNGLTNPQVPDLVVLTEEEDAVVRPKQVS
jgi:hypothetical protein